MFEIIFIIAVIPMLFVLVFAITELLRFDVPTATPKERRSRLTISQRKAIKKLV